MFLTLLFLELLFSVCGQVTTEENGHVTIKEQKTDETTEDRVTNLEVMVKTLQTKIEEHIF
jgi:hypothetical protein